MTSEIYLVKKDISKEEWHELIRRVSILVGPLKKWKIIIKNENNNIHYYIISKVMLPSIINGLSSFMLKRCDNVLVNKGPFSLPSYENISSCFIDILNRYEIKDKGIIDSIVIDIMMVKKDVYKSNVALNVYKNDNFISKHLLLAIPENILTNNFNTNKIYSCKGIPKYFDTTKILHKLSTDKVNSLFRVDTFPFLQGNYYLRQNDFAFASHSLILGSSGTGKSKLIASMIKNIIKNNENDNYKVVLIDPHAALENDIGGLGKVIDFKSIDDSINLFTNTDDIISSTEIMMSTLKNLFDNDYNSKLERVLRHSLNLLLGVKQFNFINLRKLLVDMEYRNMLLKESENIIPMSIINFFLNDFNDLRTKSYGDAISPIIAFIDELSLIPVFNEENVKNSLNDTIANNDLTLFSLDRLKLGDKVTKTISNLITAQMLSLIQSREIDNHIIFIIDEVALLENPMLSRLLSEARKYNLSLILAGQYFNQVSDDLKNSIFANVINYYIFRVSKLDAKLLTDNFNMKLYPNNDIEEQRKYLSELQNRECVIRINSNGVILPAFKAKTMDFISVPRKRTIQVKQIFNEQNNKKGLKELNFSIDSNIKLNDIILSTNRKKKE